MEACSTVFKAKPGRVCHTTIVGLDRTDLHRYDSLCSLVGESGR